jgi:hypothetical protein
MAPGRVASVLRTLAFSLVCVLVLDCSLHGQVAIGARLGSGGGSAGYTVGEVNARIRIVRSVHFTVGYEVMGGLWACAGSPLNEIRCGYDGNTVAAGIAFAPIDVPRVYGAARALIGRFERTGRYAGRQYRGTTHGTAAIAVDLELRIWGPLRIAGGFLHRQIFDGLYRDAIGTFPHFTAFNVGLTLAFWQRNDGT